MDQALVLASHVCGLYKPDAAIGAQTEQPLVPFVSPLYMSVWGASYTRLETDEGQKAFAVLQAALTDLDEQTVSQLLATLNWRHRITGSWLCGAKRWSHFADQIGALLVESKVCYAGYGYGYAFALARFADDTSIGYLTNYLNVYLPQVDLYYDQGSVLSALMWVDEQKGTNHSQRYLVPGGLWETFVANKKSGWDLEETKKHFFQNMDFCRQNF